MNKFVSWITEVWEIISHLFDPRVFITLLPALFVLSQMDLPITMTIVFSLLVMVVVASVSHWLRKIMFPYVDLEEYTKRAAETPLASAIVVFSMALIICTLVFATTLWVHH